MSNEAGMNRRTGAAPGRRWVVLGAIVFVAAAGLGYLGFVQYYREAGQPISQWDLIYLTLHLFGIQSELVHEVVPWMLVAGRMLAALFTMSALLLAFGSLCRDEIRVFRLGHSKRHVVVCGVGDKASALIRDLRAKRRRIVAIDLNTCKHSMHSMDSANLFALEDDATQPECLEYARVRTAGEVFITTGNDSLNIEIASQVINLVRNLGRARRFGRLACHVHLVDRKTSELFHQHQVFREAAVQVDVRTFNVYENAARLLWRRYLLVRGPLAVTDRRRMHVVIGGLGQMGEAVLLRVVKSGHYANGCKPAITVVDRNVAAVQGRILYRYPRLETLCDLDFVEAEIGLPDTARRVGACLAAADEIGTVVLCAGNDNENFASALQWASELSQKDVPIYVRLALATGLAELLNAERSSSALARQIDAFGLVSDCCSEAAVLEDGICQFASRFHGAYKRNRLAAGINPATDKALKDWNELDPDFRESSCEQAEHMEVKLRTFGYSTDREKGPFPTTFTDDQFLVLARMEHARWCAERWLAGWTYAPPPKNKELRTSPYLVPWDHLDEGTQKIDFDLVREILAITAKVGMGQKDLKRAP
jgi:hypothetical protein